MRRMRAGLFAIACLIGLPSASVQAATLRVPADYATINAGLAASVSGDTVLVAPGTYTDVEIRDGRTSCAFLVGGVRLLSEAGPEVTTIDMQGVGGPFPSAVRASVSDEPMWIEGFTVTGSPYGRPGIIAVQIPLLTVRDCILRDLDAGSGQGGGVLAVQIDLDVIGCHFLRCYGTYGAGLGLAQCGVRVVDSVFEDCANNAIRAYTGDIFVYDESLEIVDCRFIGNYAVLSGGAVYENVAGDVRISGCWFEDNTADRHSGAVALFGESGARVVENSVFWNNHALLITSWGGGMRVHISTEIRGCTFVANSQGSIYGGGSAVTITGGSSSLQNCIVYESQNHEAIGVITELGGYLSSTCNDFWNNEEGIGDNWIPDETDFEADPLFCDPDNGNFELSSQSPCLPPASGACGLIGAFGEGCGVVSIEDSSWGRIKEQYIGKNGGGR